MRKENFIKKVFLYSIVVLILLGDSLYAKIPKDCPATEGLSTYPSKVIIDELIEDIRNLKDSNEHTLLEIIPQFKKEIGEIFKEKPFRTKMDQFYRMLYRLHLQMIPDPNKKIEIPGMYIIKVLITSGVFRDDTFSRLTKKVEFIKEGSKRKVIVYFAQTELKIPLNNGQGFYSYHDNYCQHVTHLLFSSDSIAFEFELKKNNNLVVKNYSGVNLFGNLGTRGIVDIDLNYIELEKVEYIDKTTDAYVTARIADREFKENKHSWLLELINRFYSNTTRQPIDW